MNSMATGSIQSTMLWASAFGDAAFPEGRSARIRLAEALRALREQVTLLAGEIGGSLPEYTQHDITHLDTLWELADLIAGERIVLNPAEAFVFGGALLTHDIALSHAVYALQLEPLHSRPDWPDALAAHLRATHGRAPTASELANPPADVKNRAEHQLLRDLHAEEALRIPTIGWSTLSGDTTYLISDSALRNGYGPLIGLIAASHHWSHDRLVQELSYPVGAPSWAPPTWRIDSLMLACLLRTADAAHLDASRAPDILAAARSLPPTSLDHWTFQHKLQRPYLDEDRLVFTAPSGFNRNEISAWWLAYDILRMVDAELRGVDALLAENGKARLAARSVAHTESPLALSRTIPCVGWEPVSARVQVGDVPALIRRLGGRELYGNDSTVAVRELLSNASDAVRARKALIEYRSGSPVVGRITVALSDVAGAQWLAVSDNGIGMNKEVLSGPLLDFGRSSWLAREVVQSNPGLLASRFEPVGRFGIGFFSVFMLGDTVEVVSRALGASEEDTWVLTFGEGLSTRPVLYRASMLQRLDEPGTTVRVRLDSGMIAKDGGLQFRAPVGGRYLAVSADLRSLDELVTFAFPIPDVDVWVWDQLQEDQPRCLMGANDWIEVGGEELLRRMCPPHAIALDQLDDHEGDLIQRLASHLAVLQNPAGDPVARVALLGPFARDEIRYSADLLSTVTAGTARSRSGVYGTAGVFKGAPVRAARDVAIPTIDPEIIAAWATREAQRRAAEFESIGGRRHWAREIASDVEELGGDSGPLRPWHTAAGWLTHEELIRWLEARDELLVVHPIHEHIRFGDQDVPTEPEENVVFLELGRRLALSSNDFVHWPFEPDPFYEGGLPGRLVQAIVRAWGRHAEEVIAELQVREETRVVAAYEGKLLESEVPVVVRTPRFAPSR